MKKRTEFPPEPELRLAEIPALRMRRTWLPGAQFAAPRLDTRHWQREPGTDLDWQRTPSWHPRQLLN